MRRRPTPQLRSSMDVGVSSEEAPWRLRCGVASIARCRSCSDAAGGADGAATGTSAAVRRSRSWSSVIADPIACGGGPGPAIVRCESPLDALPSTAAVCSGDNPAIDPEFEHLAIAGGQPIEGGPNGGVFVGSLGDVGREGGGRSGHGSRTIACAGRHGDDGRRRLAGRCRTATARSRPGSSGIPEIPVTARVIVSLTTSSAASRPTWWAAYAHSRGYADR